MQAELRPVLTEYNGSIAVVVGSHVTGLGIVRSLAGRDIPILVLDYEANTAAFSRHVTQTLLWDYRRDWGQFVALLCGIGIQLRHKAVLYLTDERYCVLCAQDWHRLEPYYYPPFNPVNVTTIVSKASQLELCQNNGIPTPWIFNLRTSGDLEALMNQADDLPYPLIVRPFDKSEYFDSPNPFRIMHISNCQELVAEQSKLAAELSHGLVVAEYIPGGPPDNWGMVAYCDEKHRVVSGYTRVKISQYPYQGGTATIMAAPFNRMVWALGCRICQALKIIGPAAIEMKYDYRDDSYKYIETNFRYPRSGSMALQSEVLVPLAQYYHLTGQHDRLQALRQEQREDAGLYIEALWEWMNVLENIPRKEHLARLLKAYRAPRSVWAIWDWDDPRPGLVFGGRLVGKALKRLIGIKR